MSHTLSLELNDETYAALQRRASGQGATIASYLRSYLERLYAGPLPDAECSPTEVLPASFGSVRLGNPHGSDNDGIDADLARVYANELTEP